MNINFKKGFTIIEVVLVLAIAGLIFLMVFIALPNMQRSQRDTQRRNDYSALSANITNYFSNNNGQAPADCDGTGTGTATGLCTLDSIKKYINSTGQDPTGNNYKLKVTGTVPTTELDPATTNAGSIVMVVKNATCGAGTNGQKPVAKSGSRNFAIYGQLETGTYCLASTN